MEKQYSCGSLEFPQASIANLWKVDTARIYVHFTQTVQNMSTWNSPKIGNKTIRSSWHHWYQNLFQLAGNSHVWSFPSLVGSPHVPTPNSSRACKGSQEMWKGGKRLCVTLALSALVPDRPKASKGPHEGYRKILRRYHDGWYHHMTWQHLEPCFFFNSTINDAYIMMYCKGQKHKIWNWFAASLKEWGLGRGWVMSLCMGIAV